MKKIFILLITILSLILFYFLFTYSNISVAWSGWPVISSIANFITSFGIIFLAYQLLVQRRTFSLDQVDYLMGLSEKFIEHEKKFNEAWSILRNYNEVPTELDEQEWYRVSNALEKCYNCALFKYQIAQLINNKVLDKKLIYFLYYNEIIENSSTIFEYLVEWCGTGVDLAANYDSYEIARMITPVKELILCLDEIHENHGGQKYEFLEDDFSKLESNFVPNVSNYDVTSSNYINNYISFIKDN